jgi:hypothetical protein
MFKIKTPHLFLLLGLVAPVQSFAAEQPYCIAVGGGLGDGGTTFVAGYTKYAIVILTSTGVACLSSDSTALTVSVSSNDPAWLNTLPPVNDYIQLKRLDSTQPFKGEDSGQFALPGESWPVTCTSDLLDLPSSHL